MISNVYNNLINKYYGVSNNTKVKNEFNEWFVNTTIDLHNKEIKYLLKEKFNIPDKKESKWLFE